MKQLVNLSAVFLLAPISVLAGTLSANHYDVLVCPTVASAPWPAGQVFLFLSAVGDDGSSMYQSLGGSGITAIYDADGILKGPSDRVCGGKSLSELEEAGQTSNF